MSSIPNVCGSRYSNNAISMCEALNDYVNSETESVEWQWDNVQRTQRSKEKCDLLRNFKTISPVRKAKKYQKRRAKLTKLLAFKL